MCVNLCNIRICIKHLFLCCKHFFIRHQITNIHNPNSIMRIQRCKLLSWTKLHPVFKIKCSAKIYCIQDQHRQLKIISIYIFLFQLFLNKIIFMDLRKDLRICSFQCFFTLIHNFPDLWLYKETIGIFSLGSIGKSIQPDQRSTMVTEEFEFFFQIFFCLF